VDEQINQTKPNKGLSWQTSLLFGAEDKSAEATCLKSLLFKL
jgi:hypothetical protein